MNTVLVLGAGMVGSVMAADMAADADVTIADVRPAALAAAVERARRLGRQVKTVQADLSDPSEVRRLAERFDLVLGALASRLGFQTLEAVIQAGRPYCDISFFAEDALALDALAKQRGVTAVVDCGVAPGMSNLIAGAEVAALQRAGGSAEAVAIYVGGLPRERRWPFQYKAGFAPSDVIEEYTRPVRLVEHGRVVVREALTDPEFLDFAGLGTLEAVNTDGLRTLAHTLSVPNMKEKTLRYPGHYDLMRAFAATGLFSEQAIQVQGVSVKPRDVTAALMFPKWTYEPGEEDLTVMRIVVEGTVTSTQGGSAPGGRQRVTWDLFDTFDRASGATSMSRTTALACTAVARMIRSGRVREAGAHPPETLGARPGLLDDVVAELRSKGINYSRRSESIAPGA